MAKIRIGHQPSLTVEKAKEIINKHLGFVGSMKQGNRFHIIVKNSTVAAIIKVNQLENDTEIIFQGSFPQFWKDFTCMLTCLCTGVGFIAWIIYSVIHLNFEKELVDFVRNCPDFLTG